MNYIKGVMCNNPEDVAGRRVKRGTEEPLAYRVLESAGSSYLFKTEKLFPNSTISFL